MASVFFNEAKRAFAAGEYDWDADDMRVRLLMNTSTCFTENDAIVNIADFTTVAVSDATGYADQTLAGKSVVKDDGNDRSELMATNPVFGSLSGDATNDYQGILVFKYVDGTDANDLVVCAVDFTADITSAATQVTVPIPAEGLIQLT